MEAKRFYKFLLFCAILTTTSTLVYVFYLSDFHRRAPIPLEHFKFNASHKSKIPLGFMPALTLEERGEFIRLLRVYDRIMHRNNFTYFLDFGSLLGAYRHHGMMWWDDDLDLVMSLTDRRKLEKVVASSEKYKLWTDSKAGTRQWKFYDNTVNTNKKFPNFDWQWPFLDIFFYEENFTHIRITENNWRHFYHQKSETFPLKKMKFGGFLAPVPRKSEKYLRDYMIIEECQSSHYDHRNEKPIKVGQTIYCEDLYEFYPFVMRGEKDGVKYERLMVNGREVNDSVLYK